MGKKNLILHLMKRYIMNDCKCNIAVAENAEVVEK